MTEIVILRFQRSTDWDRCMV